MLARWLTEHCRPDQLLTTTLRLGPVPVHQGLDPSQLAELSALLLPLPSARLKLDEGDPRAGLVEAVLAEEGMALRDMRVRGVRELFFSRGERAALCVPAVLGHEFDAGDRRRERLNLRLTFELPRGSYATLVVKSATAIDPANRG
jgi:tRNA pseudouridine13 synthase